MKGSKVLLALNYGSSSLKFAFFHAAPSLAPIARGKIERIGQDPTVWSFAQEAKTERKSLGRLSPREVISYFLQWLAGDPLRCELAAAGHRVVYGSPSFAEVQVVEPWVFEELRRLAPLDPEHLPGELRLIKEMSRHFPHLVQLLCFDTAFHSNLPPVARLLPLPRRLLAHGVRRYGFHGLSYQFLMEELERVAGPTQARGRVILAHLGSGASLAAVRNGQCQDTTMGFSPASGLPMGTRSGDVDPGLVWFLQSRLGQTPKEVYRMLVEESGLLGVSERSSDFQELLQWEKEDVRSAEAIALFCYHVRKAIGALVAALGGLDVLVFSGGIGAYCAEARARCCEGLQCLGVRLDPQRNERGDGCISSPESQVSVWAIPTDEEQMIARSLWRVFFEGKS